MTEIQAAFQLLLTEQLMAFLNVTADIILAEKDIFCVSECVNVPNVVKRVPVLCKSVLNE